MNSKAKGKRGELEFARLCCDHGYDWRGKLSLSLLDKNRNTLVRAPAEKVELAKEDA